jgi:UDP-N-acetylmuramoyl-L-alanyl-D-glutamate--2,6-diaminopimelate ligase
MRLRELIEGVSVIEFRGDPETDIKGIACDSRQIKPGDLFVALRGHKEDGHGYLQDALQKGAFALVAESFEGFEGPVPRVTVKDSRKALSKISARFYGSPYRGMNLIGITGTNGKTTTSYLLESILQRAGARPGVIGTINYRHSGKAYTAPVTTPESLDLMAFLREMADAGVSHVIMEVSSHALEQGRTEDCPFKCAVFTNFSRDHLDYHQSMEAYFKAKARLFLGLKGNDGASAVINTDDPKGRELVSLAEGRVISYGLDKACCVRAVDIRSDITGLRARLITDAGEREIRSSLIGQINVYNILAASATALSLDVALDDVVRGIETLRAVPGRLEVVANPQGVPVVIDYAHTPDALLKVLTTLRPLVKDRLITVFGCGGDRDKGKRPEMGRIAGEHSDVVIITSDNPRSENPESIMTHIEEGIRETDLQKVTPSSSKSPSISGYVVEKERRKAIGLAVDMAHHGDLVLIAGKGHENYQIVGGERRAFDDRQEALLAASLK